MSSQIKAPNDEQQALNERTEANEIPRVYEEAEQCRRQALAYLHKPEATFLLRVAREFDKLAKRAGEKTLSGRKSGPVSSGRMLLSSSAAVVALRSGMPTVARTGLINLSRSDALPMDSFA